MKEAMKNLKKLTALDGVSGDEKPVRDYIISRIKDYVDNYYVDNSGNLITYKRGSGNGSKVMLDAHMDEVGLMITFINADGLLKFRTIGGIDAGALVGKRVRIGENGVPGVIGFKPLHLQSPKEREGTVDKKQLTIDIGAKNKEQAESKIEIGDLAAFAYEPLEFGDNKLMAKALDDRVGCAALIELLKYNYESDIYGCFTVQEEIGLKGAKTSTFKVRPDIALILEGTTCYDLPDTREYGMSSVCGDGPVLTVMDRTVITDKELVKHIIDSAKLYGIPYQFKRTVSGGTNAGRIQTGGNGVRVAIIALPCRYIHSPVSVMDIKDFENMIKLAKKFLETLPASITLYREQEGKTYI
ncbi:MAG: M42 family metallopeptidase [Acetivibrionales bacterium]|jgi:putative aminopeptidase FrvX